MEFRGSISAIIERNVACEVEINIHRLDTLKNLNFIPGKRPPSDKELCVNNRADPGRWIRVF